MIQVNSTLPVPTAKSCDPSNVISIALCKVSDWAGPLTEMPMCVPLLLRRANSFSTSQFSRTPLSIVAE